MLRIAHQLLGPCAAAALLAAGCAHAPVPAQGGAGEEAAAGAAERVLVTGSRIPQRVDPRGGLPATSSPVRVYSRQDVVRTGRDPNLALALQKLDPSF